MSNNTKVDLVELRDVSAIRAAVTQLQREGVAIELRENTTPRLYSEQKQRECGVCDFVLHLPNSSYDVGLKRKADGKGYEAILDTWRGDVAKQIGSTALDWTDIIDRQHQYHYSHPEHGAAPHIARFVSSYTKAMIQRTAMSKGHMSAGVSKQPGKTQFLYNVR